MPPVGAFFLPPFPAYRFPATNSPLPIHCYRYTLEPYHLTGVSLRSTSSTKFIWRKQIRERITVIREESCSLPRFLPSTEVTLSCYDGCSKQLPDIGSALLCLFCASLSFRFPCSPNQRNTLPHKRPLTRSPHKASLHPKPRYHPQTHRRQ